MSGWLATLLACSVPMNGVDTCKGVTAGKLQYVDSSVLYVCPDVLSMMIGV